METKGVSTIQFKMAKMKAAPPTGATFFVIEMSVISQ